MFVVGDCGVLAWGVVCDVSSAVEGVPEGVLCLDIQCAGVNPIDCKEGIEDISWRARFFL